MSTYRETVVGSLCPTCGGKLICETKISELGLTDRQIWCEDCGHVKLCDRCRRRPAVAQPEGLSLLLCSRCLMEFWREHSRWLTQWELKAHGLGDSRCES